MAILQFTDLGKSFGTQVCFAHATGAVRDGDRIGLIGANGTGKTTLAKVVVGIAEADEGRVSIPRDTRIAYLSQHPDLPDDATVFEAAFRALSHLAEAEHRIEEISHRLSEQDVIDNAELMEELLAELGHLQERFEREDGFAAKARTEAVLFGLGFDHDFLKRNCAVLSGGERARVGLAEALLSKPDLLILDEPTNHLDIAGVRWLESFLVDDYSGAFIVISHDRFFLDRVTNKTWEIEHGALACWDGGYTRSRELKAEHLERLQKQYQAQQQEIAKQQDFIRRYGAGQRAREAKGRLRRLDRFIRDEAINRPQQTRGGPSLNLQTERRTGAEVVSARELGFAYGERTLFSGFKLDVRPGEILAICGPNGSGKSTLLDCLKGERAPTAGAVKIGSTVVAASLVQREEFEREAPDPELAAVLPTAQEEADGEADTVLEHVHSFAPYLKEIEVRTLLGSLLFSGGDVMKPLRVLSGGERKRVAIAKLLIGDQNLLFLDEPSNHLDIPTREALETALADFTGTIILVSHDRYLLDRLADRIVWLEDGDWRTYEGNYSDMLVAQQRQAREAAARAAAEARAAGNGKDEPAPAKKKAKPKARKFKGSVTELEAHIAAQQGRLREIETALGDGATYEDPELVGELNEEYERVTAEVAELEEEWLERAE